MNAMMKQVSIYLLLVSVVSGDIFQLPLISYDKQILQRRYLASGVSGANINRTSPFKTPRRLPRRRLQGYLQNGPLYEGYGTLYVDIWVGTPPQRQTLIVDTGSSLTAFPCSGCTDCGSDVHINGPFQESKSTSFDHLTCGHCVNGRCDNYTKSGNGIDCVMAMAYREGSTWRAFEATDKVFIGRPANDSPQKNQQSAFKLNFGCQTRLSGLFKTQLADGIMGMDGSSTSFWAQMFAQHDLKQHVFSICYAGTNEMNGTEAGLVTMGGHDRRLHKTPLVYSSTRDSPKPEEAIYFVRVRRFYLRHWEGGELAKSAKPAAKVVHLNVSMDKLNEGGVILDSGSTDTYYLKTIRTEFRRVFKLLGKTDFPSKPFKSTPEEIMKLPTVLIQLVGSKDTNEKDRPNPNEIPGLAGDLDPKNPYDVILAFPPSHYMRLNDEGLYDARFYPYEDPSSGSVLGANILMGHDVVFDMTHNRIGWAQSDCKFSASSEPDGIGGVNVVGNKQVDTDQVGGKKQAGANKEDSEKGQDQKNQNGGYDKNLKKIQDGGSQNNTKNGGSDSSKSQENDTNRAENNKIHSKSASNDMYGALDRDTENSEKSGIDNVESTKPDDTTALDHGILSSFSTPRFDGGSMFRADAAISVASFLVMALLSSRLVRRLKRRFKKQETERPRIRIV